MATRIILGVYLNTGEGYGNPLQCSCLENSMDWEAPWWAIVHGVRKSQTQLSDERCNVMLFEGCLCKSEALGIAGIVQSNLSVFVAHTMVLSHFTKSGAHLPRAGDGDIYPACTPRLRLLSWWVLGRPWSWTPRRELSCVWLNNKILRMKITASWMDPASILIWG